MYNNILIILLVIAGIAFLFNFFNEYEGFDEMENDCPCGKMIEHFDDEITEDFCPGDCSTRRYPVSCMYSQTCGCNMSQTRNFNEPYYIPALGSKY